MELLAVLAAAAAALPAPDAALPRTDAGLAAALETTTRRLRAELPRWDPEDPPTRAVTLLALHHQRLIRRIGDDPRRARRVVARLPAAVRGEARDLLIARERLAAIPRSGPPPRVRTARAAPAAELRAHYAAAQRRSGVGWHVLAAVNFVESAFGKVRSASEAGAVGPMQFLPATWKAYGMGGDVRDPGDAILGAANHLRRSGAPRQLRRALYAYNRSTAYVGAILRYARRMHADERSFLTLYSWQVYARTAKGVRRLTGPGL